MAIAWMNSGNAATMIGYVVTTWHGRNGWGGLKYWVTNPGRYTLSEAIYMNQQDFLYQQNEWYPSLIKENYNFDGNEFQIARQKIAEVIKGQPTKDQIGFWHDRDVLAYYGDRSGSTFAGSSGRNGFHGNFQSKRKEMYYYDQDERKF